MAVSASPSYSRSPLRKSRTRGQINRMACMEWLTMTMVVPRCCSSRMRSKHLSWKATSPTASTSSSSSTCGATWTATEKPSRMYMPDE